MQNINRTINNAPTPPPVDSSLSGGIASLDTAKPYGLLGLCLSLVAIVLIALVYGAAAGGLAVLAEGLALGWVHPLDLIRRLETDAASDPVLALHVSLGLSLAAYVALSLAVLTLAHLRGRGAWPELIGWRPWPILKASRTYWFIASAALIYSLAANFLVGYFYPPSKDWFTVPKEGLSAAMLFILAVVLAPLTEELLFRGWIYTSLRASFGLWAAILITAATFAGAHYESTHIYALVVFPIGLALGGLRETAGSLKGSISFHAFYNAIAYALALFDIG